LASAVASPVVGRNHPEQFRPLTTYELPEDVSVEILKKIGWGSLQLSVLQVDPFPQPRYRIPEPVKLKASIGPIV